MKKHMVLLALILLCCFFAITSAKADPPPEYRFAVEMYNNVGLIGNNVPDTPSETYQYVAQELFGESLYRFNHGDIIPLKVYYPNSKYKSFYLYGCVFVNDEGGILGWLSNTKLQCIKSRKDFQ